MRNKRRGNEDVFRIAYIVSTVYALLTTLSIHGQQPRTSRIIPDNDRDPAGMLHPPHLLCKRTKPPLHKHKRALILGPQPPLGPGSDIRARKPVAPRLDETPAEVLGELGAKGRGSGGKGVVCRGDEDVRGKVAKDAGRGGVVVLGCAVEDGAEGEGDDEQGEQNVGRRDGHRCAGSALVRRAGEG